MSDGRTLTVGRHGRSAFSLPLDVATWAMAIHGVRGKGKTVTAAVICEEVLKAGVQAVIVDPTDVWWGLKSSRDGKSPGHPVVILGGEHSDLPLHADAGAAIADFVVDHGPSVILSLRHLRKGAQARFVTEFAEQLYHRKGETANRRPLLLAIDEASRFVPQRVMGETARMVGAIEDIVRLGRASGFGVVLIDQRPASVNKDVLTQIELLVCHAVTSPQDRAALKEWIRGKDSGGHEEEFLRDLASLDRGEAWFWLPMGDLFARVNVRMRETFDSSATPEIGEELVAPEQRAEVDLDALRIALADSVADAEANDPKALRKRIAELEAELRHVGQAEDEEDRAWEIVEERDRYVTAALKEQREQFREAVAPLLAAIGGLGAKVEDVVAECEDVRDALEDDDGDVDLVDAGDRTTPAPRAPAPPPPAAAPRRTPVQKKDTSGLSGPHQRILGAVAWLEAIGVRPADNVAVAFLAGYRPSGGAFNNPKGSLRSLGLIDYPAPGKIELTDEGRAVAEAPEVPRQLRAFHEMVLGKLPGPEQRILRPLLDAYPREMDVEDLAAAAGYSQGGGAFNNPRGRLRTLGLIDYPRQGAAVALPVLFPRGLR